MATNRGSTDLPATPLFGGVNQDDWPELLKHAGRIELNAGQLVYSQGDQADAFFAILAGSVEVRSRNAAGQEQILAHLAEGSVLAETSLLLGGTHSASVYASEPCALLKFPHAAFKELLEQRHHGAIRVLYNIAHSLAVRLRAAGDHVAELARGADLPKGPTTAGIVRGNADHFRIFTQ